MASQQQLVGGPDHDNQQPIAGQRASDLIYLRGGRSDGKPHEVKGKTYAWSGNISHPFDDEVQVPDLSNDDIQNQTLCDLLASELPRLLKDEFANHPEVSDYALVPLIVGQPQYARFEDFTWKGLKVTRGTYRMLDAKEKKPAKYEPGSNYVAEHFARGVDVGIGPPPSAEQVQRYMAITLSETTWWDERSSGKTRGKVDGKTPLRPEDWEALMAKAYAAWFDDKQGFHNITSDQMHTSQIRYQKYTDELSSAQLNYRASFKDKRRSYEEDVWITQQCKEIKDRDIVILRDKNHELIVLVAACAANLITASKLNEVKDAVDKFAWRYPMLKPEPKRHPTHEDVHLRHNPQWDFRRSIDPHRAVTSTDHMGIHHMEGHDDLQGTKAQMLSTNARAVKDSKHMLMPGGECDKVKHGVVGLAVKLSRVLMKAVDPDLYDECVKINRLVSKFGKVTDANGIVLDHNCAFATTGDNPYHYVALLIRVLTEGHKDSRDCINGLAGLMPFGDYLGSELVLKELGVRIAYPSGSQTLLRGRELHHYVTQSITGNRYCLVLTCKESVARCVLELEQNIPAARRDWNLLREKENLEELEQQRLDALDDGDDAAIAGQLFREEMAKVKPSKGKRTRDDNQAGADGEAIDGGGDAEVPKKKRAKKGAQNG